MPVQTIVERMLIEAARGNVWLSLRMPSYWLTASIRAGVLFLTF